jgi:hypothetical protein
MHSSCTRPALVAVVVYGAVEGAVGEADTLNTLGSWCNVTDKTLVLVGSQT